MTKLESYIINQVESSQGIKGTELACRIVSTFMEVTGEDLMHAIDGLVKSGNIVEVEYSLPQMSYRAKSFYLPSKTEVKIND